MKSKWFPATKLTMGSWEYFSLKMSFNDFFDEIDDKKDLISFNKEFEKPDLLDNVMQRMLDESRAKKSIADYLCEKDDAFFSSIVIGCLGDTPEWEHLPPPEEIRKNLDIEKREHLGYVRLDHSQKYYVLDGQHRLFAIKHILRHKPDPKKNEDESMMEKFGGIERFKDTSVNVILVTRGNTEEIGNFKPRYRRLFTSLNRYAKPTSTETNIIMDEDDTAAILTRRLIKDLDIFESTKKPENNPHINTSTKNLSSPASEKNYQFTSLATMYNMNINLLQIRRNTDIEPGLKKYNSYKMERPSDALLDSLYEPLKKQWEAIIELFPIFKNEEFRKVSRNANAALSSNKNDHLFLRPIGQEKILATLMVHLIDNADREDDDYLEIFKPIAIKDFDWDLRRPPFRDLLLVEEKKPKKNEFTWKIVEGATGTTSRLELAQRISLWLVEGEWTSKRVQELKKDVLSSLINRGGAIDRKLKAKWWEETCEIVGYKE